MHHVQKTITALSAFLWLLPPLLFLYVWPLPVPLEMLHEIWVYYFTFALATYLAIRWLRSQRRIPVMFGIAAAALALEIFNVVHFHQGDGESFRTAFFLAALSGLGLGNAVRRFPNRWYEV